MQPCFFGIGTMSTQSLIAWHGWGNLYSELRCEKVKPVALSISLSFNLHLAISYHFFSYHGQDIFEWPH